VKFSNKVTGKEFRILRGHHNQRNLNLNVELDAGMQSSTDEQALLLSRVGSPALLGIDQGSQEQPRPLPADAAL